VSLSLAGRASAGVGIVCGLLGVALTFVSFSNGFSARHVADGTAFAFLAITLALASHFPAEIGSDLRGAALGTAAFGFYLFVPARFAFDNLGVLDAGAWLGLCSVLIPLGYILVRTDHSHVAAARAPRTNQPLVRGRILALGGILMVVVSIWLEIDDGDTSYWNASHALGILMLLLAAANVYCLLRGPADIGLLVAAATFGLVLYPWVYHAFERLGTLHAGGWLAAIGGLALLAGVVDAQRTAAPAAAAPAPAQ
jgi:hypothetical protein